ncbi:hypothetical protein Bca4012_092906 [Brassica carinata]|uniref:Inosine/uridine-preferring nucleoside hydrolase domain-containing protein n=2 Tax=Brassica TaxID=3705 RepID=A0A8X7TV58_BRACI|nr:hypothetical protein Bca52824_075179 [Brassica carinata]
MIFIFGGAFFALGSINPPFEANIEIYGDPEAADVGFMSGTDITVGINISTQLKLTGKRTRLLSDVCKFYKACNVKSDLCLHDPLSFVEAVWPDLFKYKKGVVRVGTQGICVGHRLMDQALKRNPWVRFSPISVAWTINVDKVLEYIKVMVVKLNSNLNSRSVYELYTYKTLVRKHNN